MTSDEPSYVVKPPSILSVLGSRSWAVRVVLRWLEERSAADVECKEDGCFFTIAARTEAGPITFLFIESLLSGREIVKLRDPCTVRVVLGREVGPPRAWSVRRHPLGALLTSVVAESWVGAMLTPSLQVGLFDDECEEWIDSHALPDLLNRITVLSESKDTERIDRLWAESKALVDDRSSGLYALFKERLRSRRPSSASSVKWIDEVKVLCRALSLESQRSRRPGCLGWGASIIVGQGAEASISPARLSHVLETRASSRTSSIELELNLFSFDGNFVPHPRVVMIPSRWALVSLARGEADGSSEDELDQIFGQGKNLRLRLWIDADSLGGGTAFDSLIRAAMSARASHIGPYR